MSRQRNIRKRAASEEPDAGAAGDGEEECQRDKLAETRLMQQLRRRAAGTGAESLALGLGGPGIGPGSGGGGGGGAEGGRASSAEPEGGGAGGGGSGPVMDTYVKAKSIATQQNEDAHMQKYIEEQLAVRLGKSAARQDDDEELDPEARRRKKELELYTVPEDFKNELEQEVVLPGLVSTLSEVPLSARDKLASIEATEALKRRLLARVGAGTLVLEEEEEARARDAARIRRNQFTKQFGRAAPKRDLTPEELEAEARRRRFISERNSIPPRGGGGGGRQRK